MKIENEGLSKQNNFGSKSQPQRTSWVCIIRHTDFSIEWSYAPIMTNWHLPNQNTVTNRVDSVALSYRIRFFVASKFHMLIMALKRWNFLIRKPREVCAWAGVESQTDSFFCWLSTIAWLLWCHVFGKLRYVKCFSSTWKHSSGEEGFGKAPFSWTFRKVGLGGRKLKLL